MYERNNNDTLAYNYALTLPTYIDLSLFYIYIYDSVTASRGCFNASSS
jgi:hypothetical protein